MSRELLPILMIVMMFAIACYAEPRLSVNGKGEAISHWDLSGNADGWMNKAFAVYLLPAMTLLFYLVFYFIPRLAVHRKNIEYFADQLWGFKVIFVFVMFAVFVAFLIPNMGYWQGFDPLVIVIPAVALMFFYVGYMLTYTKRNHFIGVRTPWTLASDEVWEKTNNLAGKLFWAASALTFVSLVAPSDVRLWIIIAPLAAIVVTIYFYSLFEYNWIMSGRHARAKARACKAKRRK